MEDGIKGRKIIWEMERRKGRLYGRWNDGKEDYMEDVMKGRTIIWNERKIIWKME